MFERSCRMAVYPTKSIQWKVLEGKDIKDGRPFVRSPSRKKISKQSTIGGLAKGDLQKNRSEDPINESLKKEGL